MAKRRRRERQRVSARRRVETHKSGFENMVLNIGDDVNLFNLDRPGTRRIDILPYEAGQGNPHADPGQLYFERTYWVHRGIGPNQESYVCPARTAKKPCPVCEYRAKLQKDPKADEELIRDLAPKERQLWNVIDRDDPDRGVQIWDISYHLFGKLLDAEIRNADEEDGYEYFADLEDGFTLKLGVAEDSFAGRTYYRVETIAFKRRPEPYDEEILEKVYCLDDLLIIPEYNKLKAVFLQTNGGHEEEEEEEQEEAPQRAEPARKPKPPKARKPAPKQEEPAEVDEDWDDWWGDEEEEKPKPSRGKRRRAEPPFETDEDGGDDEAGDDDDDWWDDWDE